MDLNRWSVRASTRTVWLVVVYGAVVVGTLVALALMTWARSSGATDEGWIHAAIVAGLAVMLVVRLRAARSGNRRGLVALGIIAGVLFFVNVVEALLPGLFEPWMRIEMTVIAALMLALLASVVLDIRSGRGAA